MTDNLETMKQSMANINGFSIIEEDGKQKVKAPDMVLPQYAIDRIKFFRKYMEDGLSFYGCLNFILAYDEQESQKEFGYGAYEEWVPVTEEFKNWRDEYFAKRDAEIAVALLYGMGEEIEADD